MGDSFVIDLPEQQGKTYLKLHQLGCAVSFVIWSWDDCRHQDTRGILHNMMFQTPHVQYVFITIARSLQFL